MAPAPAMFARGSTGGGVRFCRHVHFAPDLQGGEGGCWGGEGGGAVYEAAVAEQTGRRASGVVAAPGGREAAEAPGKGAPETSRSFGGVSCLRHSGQQRVNHIWKTVLDAQHIY